MYVISLSRELHLAHTVTTAYTLTFAWQFMCLWLCSQITNYYCIRMICRDQPASVATVSVSCTHWLLPLKQVCQAGEVTVANPVRIQGVFVVAMKLCQRQYVFTYTSQSHHRPQPVYLINSYKQPTCLFCIEYPALYPRRRSYIRDRNIA